MSEMVEEVRLVIHAGLEAELTIAEIARNVIEAMREPTDEQRNHYYELSHRTETFNDAHWERAIDAALK